MKNNQYLIPIINHNIKININLLKNKIIKEFINIKKSNKI